MKSETNENSDGNDKIEKRKKKLKKLKKLQKAEKIAEKKKLKREEKLKKLKKLKRKKLKKVDDGSGSERLTFSDFCGFCRGTREKNKYDEEEDLLTCSECGNSGKYFYVSVLSTIFHFTSVIFCHLCYSSDTVICLKLVTFHLKICPCVQNTKTKRISCTNRLSSIV